MRSITNHKLDNQVIAEASEKLGVDEEEVRRAVMSEEKDSCIYEEVQNIAKRIWSDGKKKQFRFEI